MPLRPGLPDTGAVSALLIEAGTVPFAAVLMPDGSAGRGLGRLGLVNGGVSDGGHRLLLAEPGPGRERLTELVVP